MATGSIRAVDIYWYGRLPLATAGLLHNFEVTLVNVCESLKGDFLGLIVDTVLRVTYCHSFR